MELSVRGKRCAVRIIDDGPEVTKSGLILAGKSKERELSKILRGQVLDSRIPDLHKGMTVTFHHLSGHKFDYQGVLYAILDEEDCLCYEEMGSSAAVSGHSV